MLPNYFVLIWNNEPVGKDSSSGGYPYKTDYPGNVFYFRTKEEALDYANVFNYPMEVKEIQFRITNA